MLATILRQRHWDTDAAVPRLFLLGPRPDTLRALELFELVVLYGWLGLSTNTVSHNVVIGDPHPAGLQQPSRALDKLKTIILGECCLCTVLCLDLYANLYMSKATKRTKQK